jgi:hypothetical protein
LAVKPQVTLPILVFVVSYSSVGEVSIDERGSLLITSNCYLYLKKETIKQEP